MILRRLVLAALLLALAGAALAAVYAPTPARHPTVAADELLDWCRADRIPASAPDVCAVFRAPR